MPELPPTSHSHPVEETDIVGAPAINSLEADENAAALDAWQRASLWWRDFLGDQVFPVRLASHVALLLIAGLVLILSRVNLPQWDVVRIAPALPAEAGNEPALAFTQAAVGGSPLQESGVLLRAPVPFTEIPDRPRLEIITYTVQVEDTVIGIAEQFGLNPNTIVWSNQELTDNPFLLEVGQSLIILPVDGVYHTVRSGETIRGIGAKYQVPPEKIATYELNGLESVDSSLVTGQKLVVPNGRIEAPKPVQRAPVAPWRAQDFVWPAYGSLTQGFWLPAHPAIDIGAPRGAAVRAADAGVVSSAGWSSAGYGNYIIISHAAGFKTLYAHLSRIDVAAGNQVVRGQQIGLVGSTGRSTGPHLHFEISLNGRAYNPLLYLP